MTPSPTRQRPPLRRGAGRVAPSGKAVHTPSGGRCSTQQRQPGARSPAAEAEGAECAEVVAKGAQDRGIPLPFAFGPSRPGEFKPEVEEVVTALKPKLTASEKNNLDGLQGKWPQYPKLFLDLARKHDLAVPGV